MSVFRARFSASFTVFQAVFSTSFDVSFTNLSGKEQTDGIQKSRRFGAVLVHH